MNNRVSPRVAKDTGNFVGVATANLLEFPIAVVNNAAADFLTVSGTKLDHLLGLKLPLGTNDTGSQKGFSPR